MKKNQYICAYGHVMRVSDRVATEQEAAKNCFGVVDRVTCLAIAGNWKYTSQKSRTELFEQLRKLHREKTGNELQ